MATITKNLVAELTGETRSGQKERRAIPIMQTADGAAEPFEIVETDLGRLGEEDVSAANPCSSAPAERGSAWTRTGT